MKRNKGLDGRFLKCSGVTNLRTVAGQVEEQATREQAGVPPRPQLRPLIALDAEAADTRPVIDLQLAQPVEKNVEVELAEVVPDDDVRVVAGDVVCERLGRSIA